MTNEVAETATVSPEAVRTQLARILQGSNLAASSHLRALLSFLVERTLERKTAELKEYTIAVEVFARPASFDPRLNPIVRVQASNLRTKLKQYYAEAGSEDPLVIELPKGTYIPLFMPRPEKAAAPAQLKGATL